MTDEMNTLLPDMDDVLATPELETPPAEPDAHRGTIEAVTLETYDSGATAMVVSLHSSDANFDDTYKVFLPKGFVEDIHINPADLPEEEGNKQRTQYRIGIANSTKDATLQSLRNIAVTQGRTLQGAQVPQNIEEYVALFNALLSGVEVVFARRPDKNQEDPRFKNRLRIQSIYDISVVNNPKALKKYRKMWEQ